MAEAPLPEGWEKKFDTNKNKPFYVNHNDKTTHWQDPRGIFINMLFLAYYVAVCLDFHDDYV